MTKKGDFLRQIGNYFLKEVIEKVVVREIFFRPSKLSAKSAPMTGTS